MANLNKSSGRQPGSDTFLNETAYLSSTDRGHFDTYGQILPVQEAKVPFSRTPEPITVQD